MSARSSSLLGIDAERRREADRRAVQRQGEADRAELAGASGSATTMRATHLTGACGTARRAHGQGRRPHFHRRQRRRGTGLRLRRRHRLRLVSDHAVDLARRSVRQRTARATASTRHRRERYAIVQAEDEIAAIGMVIGAGWNGARAFTATSGPGISLMQEFFGLAYFAEIPAVVFDVQRGGPSTGMPTRTQQSDVLLAAPMPRTATPSMCCCSPKTRTRCFEFARRGLRSRRAAADAGLRDARSRHRHERLAVRAVRLGRGPQARPRQGDDRRGARKPAGRSAAISTSTATAFPIAPARRASDARRLFHARHEPRPLCALHRRRRRLRRQHAAPAAQVRDRQVAGAASRVARRGEGRRDLA